MNKSKFLKKSLALLLAFMLVFAMIPLGAAAAGELPTGFTMMYINGGAKTLENDTFSADIGLYDEEVDLMLAANSLDTQAGAGHDATMQVVKGDSVMTEALTDTGTVATDEKTVNLADWGTEADGVVTITLRMTSADNSKSKTYTVKLTRKDVNVTTNLNETATAGVGSYSAKVNNDTKSIDLVVARGALASASKATFRVSTVEGATINPVAAIANNQAQVVAVTNSNEYDITVGQNKNTFEVVSQSGGNKSEWTVNVTEVDGLLSFSVNGVEGVITDEAGNDGVPDTITVSLPRSVAYDKFGDAIDHVKLPVDFTFYGNGSTLKINGSSYKNGESVDFGNLSTTPYDGSNDVKLTCAGVTDVQTYSLKVKLAKSSDTTIYSAQLDEEDATVEGGKISAQLPMKKSDGTTDTNLGALQVVLFTDPSVKSVSGMETITTDGNAVAGDGSNLYKVDGKQGWTLKASGTTPNSDKSNWDTISNGTIVTVTAEDGSTAQYTISASIDRNTTEAYLSAMYLKDGAGNTYEGEIKEHTITFTVPYMTIKASDWTVFATPNNSARVVYGTNPVKNGTTDVEDLAISTHASLSTTKNANLKAKAIAAVNKNNKDVKTEYDVIINLEAPKTGDTLSGNITVSAQIVDPAAALPGSVASRNEHVYSRITTENTVSGRVDTNVKIDATNTGTITIEPPYSLSSKNDELAGDIYNIITDFAANNGGVAFLAQHDAVPNYYISTPLNALVNDKTAFNASCFTADDITNAVDTSKQNTIVVLPEEKAREVLTANKNWSTTGWIIGDTAGLKFDGVGTIYTIKESPKDPSPANNLKTMTVKDKELTIRNGRITGVLPWSATAEDNTTNVAANARFVEFTLDPFAILTASDDTAPYTGKDRLNSKGEWVDAGTPSTAVDDPDNIKLLFVREKNDKKSVKVYTYDGVNTDELADGEITVWAENRLSPAADASVSTQTYTFDLTWADANTEAAITEFKLGNSRGTISSDRKINVVVPYGTDLKGLITTFTASEGATVTMGSVELISGKTALNFSDPVTLIVTSEDGKKHLEYTVTVTASDKFTDVPESAWYYDAVMKAADLGLITGKGNGIFAPMENVKRGDFALMIARMDNGGEEKWQEVAKTYTTSAFIDVDSDAYYSAAIAYCKDKGYIDGNSDGTFNAERTIKREEMAKFLCNVAGLKEVTSPASKFADDASISGWAKGYVYAVAQEGIMNGVPGNKFAPKNVTPRCQAATALVNYTESK